MEFSGFSRCIRVELLFGCISASDDSSIGQLRNWNDVVKKEAKQETKKVDNRANAGDAAGGFDAGAFLAGTREELGKVVWPTRQQLISESAAVILMVSLSATFIYLVDKLFSWASRQVF